MPRLRSRGRRLACAAAGVYLVGSACQVADLDERGKACTGVTCPGGLPCVGGICGGSAVGDGGVATPGDGSVLLADGGVLVVPPERFALVVSPAHVVLDPNDSFDITVKLARGEQFTDAVDVAIQGQGADLTTNPASLAFAGSVTEASFSLKAGSGGPDTAPGKDLTLSFLGIARTNTSVTAQAGLGVRIGSFLLAADKSTTVTVPDWASGVVLKVWGAGGGAGSDSIATGTPISGANGGAGGFASGTFVLPSAAGGKLTITVGEGGQATTSNGAIVSGGGGGYSMVSFGTGAEPLIVAGGGGGGSSGYSYRDSIGCSHGGNGGPGAGGGGGNAEPIGTPNRSATTTAPGAAGVGGSTAGASLQGGSGNLTTGSVDGGPPGGGSGGFGPEDCPLYAGNGAALVHGGGGGGGWFGGGGGGAGGGGGGSGMIAAGATQTIALAGVGGPPATSDPDYGSTNAAVGGAAGTSPGAGGHGRIVVRLAKP